MEWLNVKNRQELEKLSLVNGKRNLNRMKLIIKTDIKNYIKEHGFKEKAAFEMINLKSSSWAGLYDRICIFKDMINTFSSNKAYVVNENLSELESNKEEKYNDVEAIKEIREIEYFKSEEDRLLFYILEMDGKKRSENLGITRSCFLSKKNAQKWRNEISKKVHPDKTNNPKAQKAAAKINQLYKEMIGND
ncbi:MAG: hypothetical protein ACRCYE_14565 [Sarcina sp.]